MVAIKVLEHALILQDDITRETLLSTSITHPGVVCILQNLMRHCLASGSCKPDTAHRGL